MVNYTWNDTSVNPLWDLSSNWTPNGVPTSASDVAIFASTSFSQVNIATTGLTINSDISLNRDMSFNVSVSNSINGVISGNYAITKIGSETLTLVGYNTYTGNTIINNGTLQFGNGNSILISSANIINNATIAFNNSINFIYNGNISGTGEIIKDGGGIITITLANPNTYSGNTTITNGYIEFNVNDENLTYIGNIIISNSPSSITFNCTGSNLLTMSGIISGNGQLVKIGTGILRLTGNNTYSGGTMNRNGGTLIIGHANAIGTTGTIYFGNAFYGGGLLQLFDTTDYSSRFSNDAFQKYFIDTSGLNVTFDSSLNSSGGTFTKQGSGTLTLTGTNTYSGNTTITNGSLQIGSGGTSGSISSNVINNSAIIFNRSDTLTYSGVISGTGTLTKTGSGTANLSGDNTYSGNTTISVGTLVFNYANGTTYAGTISNATALDISSANTFTLSNVISGNGTLTKTGSGTLQILGENTYTGNTTINTGTLVFNYANGNTYASTISNATALDISSDNTFTLSGAITGAGTLTKNGSGTLILSGNNNYSGASTVNTGILDLSNGIINSNLTMQPSTTLKGNGSINGLTRINGNLDIGASPGVFTFTDLSLNSTSTTTITLYGPSYEYPPTLHSNYPKDPGAIDHIYVTNQLTIDPAAQFVLASDVPSDISMIQQAPAYTWSVIEASNSTYTLPLNITFPAGSISGYWTMDVIENTGASDEIVITYWNRIACLTEDAKVLTPYGYINVTKLQDNDYVLTDDNRKVKIIKISKSIIKSSNKSNPYIIPKNSIGPNYPPEELKISGSHLIKYGNKWVLPRLSDFEQDTSKQIIKYYHIQLENYETDNLVVNGGTIIESLGGKEFKDVQVERLNNLIQVNSQILNKN
jgi:autotransporter-associated beta strand protein